MQGGCCVRFYYWQNVCVGVVLHEHSGVPFVGAVCCVEIQLCSVCTGEGAEGLGTCAGAVLFIATVSHCYSFRKCGHGMATASDWLND